MVTGGGWPPVLRAASAGRTAVVLLAAWLCAALPAPAQPTPAASGSRNVYLAGSTVRPAAPVEGDFFGAGAHVIVDQPVRGDVFAAGSSVDVRAPVGDDLRAAGRELTIDGPVGGELSAAGGRVGLTRTAQIGRGASLMARELTIDGKVDGNLSARAGRIVLNGEITGDARLAAQQIELGPTARIGGALRHASGTFRQHRDAVVAGAVTRDEPDADDDDPRPAQREREWHMSGPAWVGLALGYLALLAAAAVFVLLFPRFSAQAAEQIQGSPWLALATGVGVLAGVPVLALLLMVTLLGLPLGLAALSLYPVLLLAGFLTGVVFVARKLRAALGRPDADTSAGVIGSVALALLALLALGRLPMLGPLTLFLTLVAGLGACVLHWRSRWQRRQPPDA